MRVLRWRQFIKCKRNENDYVERKFYDAIYDKELKKYKHNGKKMGKFFKLIMETEY